MPLFRKNSLSKPPHSPEERKKKLISLLSLGIVALFCLTVSYFVGRPLIRFVGTPEEFRAWVNAHGFWGKIAFIGMMAFQVIVAIIPGEPLEMGAGYAFGPWQGLLLCLIGIAVGSIVICFIVKRWGLKAVEAFFPLEKIQSLHFLRDSRRLNLLVFLLFFIPGTPKDLLTYCIWLTPMKFSTYLLISSVARIPSIVTSTLGGDALGSQKYAFAIWVFSITAVISIVGIFIYQRITARNAGKKEY